MPSWAFSSSGPENDGASAAPATPQVYHLTCVPHLTSSTFQPTGIYYILLPTLLLRFNISSGLDHQYWSSVNSPVEYTDTYHYFGRFNCLVFTYYLVFTNLQQEGTSLYLKSDTLLQTPCIFQEAHLQLFTRSVSISLNFIYLQIKHNCLPLWGFPNSLKIYVWNMWLSYFNNVHRIHDVAICYI